MRILLTGHTGFKGSWMSLMLNHLGHEVFGYALPPEEKSLFNQAHVEKVLASDKRADIRSLYELSKFIKDTSPEFIIHLAAQPLVLESYRIPHETFTINTEGTNNLLQASRMSKNLQGILVITTDKVYLESTKNARFVEGDPLGGSDPYSASKAAADLLAQSIALSWDVAPIGIARAGNVIGGGDWSVDRLLPDLARAMTSGERIVIRYPHAVRPWQHVLDCLDGYVQFMNHIVSRQDKLEILNFGPNQKENWTVLQIINYINDNLLNGELSIQIADAQHHESSYLQLESSKANQLLKWSNRFETLEAVKKTVSWYEKQLLGRDMQSESLFEIATFLKK